MIPAGILGSARVGSTWTPASLPSLDLWLKADSLSLADGASVTTWADSSGVGNDGTPSTGTPIYRTAQINGLPAVDFSATNFNTAASASSAAHSVAVVVRLDSFTAARTVISSNGSNGGLQLRFETTGFPALLQAGVAAIGDPGTTALTLAAWAIVIATYDSTADTYAFRVAKAASGSGTSATNLTAARTIRVGANYNGSEAMDGMIAELIHSSTVWSGSDIAAVESHLGTKYAL